MSTDNKPEMIPASLVYTRYGVPRALLRQLVADGVVRCIETFPTQTNVFRTYCAEDIERFLNGGASGTYETHDGITG